MNSKYDVQGLKFASPARRPHITNMTFETGKTEMTCSCGAVSVVPYKDYPEKDKGQVTCPSCGGLLHKWKGTRDFGAAVLKTDAQ